VIRNKKNISQQKIADFLGVDRKTYVSWESGTVDIKSSYIPKLTASVGGAFLHCESNQNNNISKKILPLQNSIN